MPDVWINLAHVYFAQGNFALAVKMVSIYYFHVPFNYLKFFSDEDYMLIITLVYAVPKLLAEVLLQHRLTNTSVFSPYPLRS